MGEKGTNLACGIRLKHGMVSRHYSRVKPSILLCRPQILLITESSSTDLDLPVRGFEDDASFGDGIRVVDISECDGHYQMSARFRSQLPKGTLGDVYHRDLGRREPWSRCTRRPLTQAVPPSLALETTQSYDLEEVKGTGG